jgi:hypothetical protein
MKILAIEHENEGATSADFAPHLDLEAAHVWQLYQDGVVREIYFRADYPSAILMLECENVDAAEQTLATFPLVKAGLIRFEIIPLAAYPGFGRLFTQNQKEA